MNTMVGPQALALFVIAFEMILAQPPHPPNIPSHCRGPPPGVEKPSECCKIPPMFDDKDLEACGIQKLEDQPQQGRFRGPPDCSKQKCVLTKYDLLRDDKVDPAAVSAFVDEWAERNPVFKPTVESAKKRCLGRDLPGPPQICEEDKLVFCIGSTMYTECPVWEESDDCKKLKDHIESCKAAAPKPL